MARNAARGVATWKNRRYFCVLPRGDRMTTGRSTSCDTLSSIGTGTASPSLPRNATDSEPTPNTSFWPQKETPTASFVSSKICFKHHFRHIVHITWRLFSILSILSWFCLYYSVLHFKVNKVVQNLYWGKSYIIRESFENVSRQTSEKVLWTTRKPKQSKQRP